MQATVAMLLCLLVVSCAHQAPKEICAPLPTEIRLQGSGLTIEQTESRWAAKARSPEWLQQWKALKRQYKQGDKFYLYTTSITFGLALMRNDCYIGHIELAVV